MSEVKGKIIEIFASQQWMKAADVLKTAKEKGIPPSTVFRWLKKMTQEGILEKQHESKKLHLTESTLKKCQKHFGKKQCSNLK